jgi:hypothetical protein
MIMSYTQRNIIATASLPLASRKSTVWILGLATLAALCAVILAAQIVSDPATFLAGINQAGEALAESF